MKLYLLTVIYVTVTLLSSCKTYLIPKESFVKQMASSNHTEVATRGPYGGIYIYESNGIKEINCIDKEGKEKSLINSPSIEMRITHGAKNKRTVFYFDTVVLQDSVITGNISRFIPNLTRTISLRSISKIEIQDGKKNFKYIKN